MRQHAQRLTVLALAAASMAFVGCDGPRSQRDKEIQENIRKAAAERASKRPTTQSLASNEAAARVQGASTEQQLVAKLFVGQDNYNLAVSMLGQLDEQETAAARSLEKIRTAMAAIVRNNVQMKVLAGADPAEVVKAMDTAKADQSARSSEAAALLKKTQELATAKGAQIKETQEKLAAATTEMNQLFQKSELTKGQESVDLYAKAVALRQTVQNTSRELAEQQLELSRLQRTIGEATAAQATADAAVAATEKNRQQVLATWEQTKKAMDECLASSKSIMESQIAPEAREYARAMTAAAGIRKQILERLDKAASGYQATKKEADALYREFMDWKQSGNSLQSPSLPARQQLVDTHDPQRYSMLLAKTSLIKGMVYLNLVKAVERQSLFVESELKPALAEAKLMVPAELTPSEMVTQLTDAKKEAETLLNEADGVFSQTTESAIAAVAKESGMLRLASQYALYSLKGGNANLQTAQGVLRELVKTSGPIPRLPGDLEARTITRSGPAGKGSGASAPPPTTPVPPTTPTSPPAAPGPEAPGANPANPGGIAPPMGTPDLSGLTNLIPGMRKKDPNKPTPTPDDNK